MICSNTDADRCKYEPWKKISISIKSKSSEEKVVHKMKIGKEVAERTLFKQLFKSEIKRFRDHAKRIQNQFAVQMYSKINCSQIMYTFTWILLRITDVVQKREFSLLIEVRHKYRFIQ